MHCNEFLGSPDQSPAVLGLAPEAGIKKIGGVGLASFCDSVAPL